MPSIASSSRSIKPPVSYRDAQPAVGKLRPWTRQKVEANARVKERAQVRRAEDAAKKDALIKFHEQPSAQRRADPKFQKAERDTSAQIGKVFAALAGRDERIAGKLCAGLPSLMKPGTDRNMSADAYDRNLRDILDHKVGKMTDAELQAVAKGVDGITHFRSDQADLHAVAQAVTSERARRQPQQEAALHACKSLSGGDLSGALKGIQRARGNRDNRMDWKSTMADMTPGELMTLLEQFTPTKNGGPSVATQTLSSMNFISKEGIGTEHPEIRQTGNDMTAIVTAAWDLLPEGSRQHIDLNEAVKQIKNATSVSDDAAVRDALRKGFGLEISNEKQMIFTGGRAGATVDANVRKDLASYNLNAGKKKDPQEAYQAASTRVRESINLTAATAKSPFIRPDGKAGSLDGRGTSTFQEIKKDGKLFVKCVDSYDKPSFKLVGGAISEGWSPEKVTVRYTLQVGKNGDVTLAEPVSVNYSLDPAVKGQIQSPSMSTPPGVSAAPTRAAPTRAAPATLRAESLDGDDEDIQIPFLRRQLAVAPPTPEEQRRQAKQALEVLGLSEGANASDIRVAYEQKSKAAALPAEKQALAAAYDMVRPRLRDTPQETFTSDQFNTGALFAAGVDTPFFKALHAYAQQEHSEENTAFCIKAEAFDSVKFGTDESYRKTWEKDIDDLNIAGDAKTKLKASISGKDSHAMSVALKEAQAEIHKMLSQDTFRRFITAMNNDQLRMSQVRGNELTNYMREMRDSYPGPLRR